jgi:hypothetical protein
MLFIEKNHNFEVQLVINDKQIKSLTVTKQE